MRRSSSPNYIVHCSLYSLSAVGLFFVTSLPLARAFAALLMVSLVLTFLAALSTWCFFAAPEPTSALDPTATGVIEDVLLGLREHYTLACVTHDLAQARRVADTVAGHDLTPAYVTGAR